MGLTAFLTDKDKKSEPRKARINDLKVGKPNIQAPEELYDFPGVGNELGQFIAANAVRKFKPIIADMTLGEVKNLIKSGISMGELSGLMANLEDIMAMLSDRQAR